jgi:hypothetical protein
MFVDGLGGRAFGYGASTLGLGSYFVEDGSFGAGGGGTGHGYGSSGYGGFGGGAVAPAASATIQRLGNHFIPSREENLQSRILQCAVQV